VVHAPAGAQPVRSDESLDLRWWPVDDLPDPDGESGLAEMLAAAGLPAMQGKRRSPH
jgi:hypothetical protein